MAVIKKKELDSIRPVIIGDEAIVIKKIADVLNVDRTTAINMVINSIFKSGITISTKDTDLIIEAGSLENVVLQLNLLKNETMTTHEQTYEQKEEPIYETNELDENLAL